MTFEFIAILLCGAAAGGFISGLAGFGTALFALGFWLQIMTPADAVPLAIVMAIISGVPGVGMIRQAVINQPKRLARFVIPAFAGIPLGVALLSIIDTQILKIVIAGFLVLYGGFFTVRKNLPKMSRPTPIIDSVVGFLGGVLGGSAALSGALPTMWCAMRPWPKEETRAVIQPFNVLVLIFAALILAFKGVYDTDALIRIAIAFPATVISANLGMFIFKQLPDELFRRLLIVMMLLAGLILLIREIS